MNRPRGKFLARPTLARDEHGRVDGSDEKDPVQHLAHRFGATDDPRLDLEPVSVQLVPQRNLDLIGIRRGRDRFVQIEQSGDPAKFLRIALRDDGQQGRPGNSARKHAGQVGCHRLVETPRENEGHFLHAGAEARVYVTRRFDHFHVVPVRCSGLANSDGRLQIPHLDEDSGQGAASRSVVAGEAAADQVHGVIDEHGEDVQAI